MTNISFLLYFPDPYGVGNSQFAIVKDEHMRILDGGEVSQLGNIVTYDAGTLIDELRRSNLILPKNITDISDAIRLCTGISRADGGEKEWDLWRHFRPYFAREADWRLCRDAHEARAVAPTGQRLVELFGAFANAITALWNRTLILLSERGESKRFFVIEQPVSSIFHNRQYRGIPIKTDSLGNFISKASSEKYRAYQDVAKLLNLSPTGLTYWQVGKYIDRTDMAGLSDDVTGYTLRDQMKLASRSSKFAAAFTDFADSARDLDILTRLSDSAARVFPTVQTVGTITSRILFSDPYLQELRRQFRSSLAAEPGSTLAYFDYSQFEPGIMASLSQDVEFIDLYNRGDVYEALSVELFGSPMQRQLCKRAFLGFSYGMQANRIASLVAGDSKGNDFLEIERKILAFFERFKVLADFKKRLERELQTKGSVATLLGNHRKRTSSGRLTPKEKRWAISQVIQGNASLIFKTALLKIEAEFGSDSMLLPMHDAILMQLPDDQLEAAKERISLLMRLAFQDFCPGVEVRVTVGDFSA